MLFPSHFGRPNIFPDYTKTLTFQVIGRDLRVIIDCLVTGEFSGSPFNSIEVPTYEPIMILRDPPGSYSKAVYENVETTLMFYDRQFKQSRTYSSGLTYSHDRTEAESECEGLGFMVRTI